jgi:pimeloyl-ACP methyl ester carboxylesterase
MDRQPLDLSRRHLLALTGAAAAAAATGCGGAAAAPLPAAQLFRTDVGSGTNVMLLHGWTCDSHDWSWQLPVLEGRYRVVAVDLRGHGRSEVMPSGSYLPANYVADIEALIDTQFPGQKFVLVGHSMGAQIAARLAEKRPDLVSAIVSIDGSLGFSADLVPLFQQTVDQLQSGDPGVVGPQLFKLFYDPATDPAYKRWHARRLQGTQVHVVRESFGPLFLGPDQVGVGDASGVFCRKLSLPFYHLCRDPDQASRMRPWFSHPKSKVDVWNAAGHWIMLDRKDDVNAAITAWIDAL